MQHATGGLAHHLSASDQNNAGMMHQLRQSARTDRAKRLSATRLGRRRRRVCQERPGRTSALIRCHTVSAWWLQVQHMLWAQGGARWKLTRVTSCDSKMTDDRRCAAPPRGGLAPAGTGRPIILANGGWVECWISMKFVITR